MQMVINLAPVSLSNKKWNWIPHLIKIGFCEEKFYGECLNTCPQTRVCTRREPARRASQKYTIPKIKASRKVHEKIIG